jgi:hypothetical protein
MSNYVTVQRPPISERGDSFEASKSLPAHPSDKSSNKIKIRKEHSWNGTDLGKVKVLGKETCPRREAFFLDFFAP